MDTDTDLSKTGFARIRIIAHDDAFQLVWSGEMNCLHVSIPFGVELQNGSVGRYAAATGFIMQPE